MHTFMKARSSVGSQEFQYLVGYLNPLTKNFTVLNVFKAAMSAADAVNYLNGGSPEIAPYFDDEVIV